MNRSTTPRFLLSTTSPLIACLVLGSAIAAPAFADGTDSLHFLASKVSFSDLDLSRPADLANAHERVHQAARNLCARVADPESVAHQPAYVACIETSMAQAEPRLRKLAAAASSGAARLASR
jgi:UrcA family protein